MSITFLEKIRDLTKTSEVKKHQDLRAQLTQDLKNRIESAARAGNVTMSYCNFYDHYPEPDGKQEDYKEVLKYFQQEGFVASLLLKEETFIYKIDWRS